MNIPDTVIDWLLEGEPWVQYRTRLDLLEQGEHEPAVAKARQEMLLHPQVQALLAELSQWPGTVLNSHKSAGLLMHKLTFIADLGLHHSDPGMEQILPRILEHTSQDGPFQLPTKVAPAYGGSGQETWAWALCDAPVTLYGLLKFGLGNDPRVQKALQYLMGLVRENGWPCAVSPELGRWRGPGRKDDPCPYANMVMLKALAQTSWCDSPAAHNGAETALTLWQESRERHPYIFYMGNDFRKLKAPLIWYDLLHMLSVLVRFPWLKGDTRLQEMLDLLAAKADDQGLFTPESIWKAWGDWDFGQKKAPSRWLTLASWSVLKSGSEGGQP